MKIENNQTIHIVTMLIDIWFPIFQTYSLYVNEENEKGTSSNSEVTLCSQHRTKYKMKPKST